MCSVLLCFPVALCVVMCYCYCVRILLLLLASLLCSCCYWFSCCVCVRRACYYCDVFIVFVFVLLLCYCLCGVLLVSVSWRSASLQYCYGCSRCRSFWRLWFLVAIIGVRLVFMVVVVMIGVSVLCCVIIKIGFRSCLPIFGRLIGLFGRLIGLFHWLLYGCQADVFDLVFSMVVTTAPVTCIIDVIIGARRVLITVGSPCVSPRVFSLIPPPPLFIITISSAGLSCCVSPLCFSYREFSAVVWSRVPHVCIIVLPCCVFLVVVSCCLSCGVDCGVLIAVI